MISKLLPWLKRSPRRPLVTEIRATKLEFLGEQDGPIERDLKARWLPILSANADISRAFLARATYQDGALHVVLGLCSKKQADLALINALRIPYAALMHKDCPLDMSFLNKEQECQLEKVCAPFYTAA